MGPVIDWDRNAVAMMYGVEGPRRDRLLGQVMRPRLPDVDQVKPYLARIDAIGAYSNRGPLVRELELRHAERLGVLPEQVVALSSGTAALTAAVSTSGAQTWRLPAFSFPAPAHAVVNAGRDLDIADVEPDTWQLAASAESEGVGLLPVLPFGAPVSLSTWPESRDVIVDAAASLGAEPAELTHLPPHWCVVFSLGATKLLSCGEGGLVVCGAPERAEAVRSWSHFALDGERSATGPGTNAAMSEIHAAYGLASLDSWLQDRLRWMQVQSAALAHSRPWPGLPHTQPLHPYWIVRFPDQATTLRAEALLKDKGIASRRWWGPGLHRMPAFRRRDASFPVTDVLAQTTLGLPIWRDMPEPLVERVGEVLRALDAEVVS